MSVLEFATSKGSVKVLMAKAIVGGGAMWLRNHVVISARFLLF